MKFESAGLATSRAVHQLLIEQSRSLRIAASARSATLAVTLFGLLDTRVSVAGTLSEIGERRGAHAVEASV